MENILKSAVTLSILAAPSKLGLWNSLPVPSVELLKRLIFDNLKTQEIIAGKYSANPDKASDLIIERCIKQQVRIITIWDKEYPQLLKEIHNPPLVLYLSGTITGSRMISVVGTRDSDEKSEEITRKISSTGVHAGYTIVSGMAAGIDRNAHLGALNAGGKTIAVLPGGVDIIYPYKNKDIYARILKSGQSAVISEYPPGIGTGQKWTFARRNRIISGLSEAVIVVQAPVKSGAMITARYAVEQNRDLFVCPGNAFDEKYGGCNELIRDGAAIFSDMNDFFPASDPEYNPDQKQELDSKKCKIIDNQKKNNTVNVNLPDIFEFTGNVEIAIYEELKKGKLEIDNFIRTNTFTVDEVNQGITLLEIAGYIEKKGNIIYRV